MHCKNKWVLLLVYCTQRLSFYSCAELPPSRSSKLSLRSVICWNGPPISGLSLLYPLESRRAVGFQMEDRATMVPSYRLYTKSGANSNRSSYLSRIVPTTADLSSMFNLQCLSNMFFFYVYLNIPSRSASFTVKCCGLVFFIHLTWIWHRFITIFKRRIFPWLFCKKWNTNQFLFCFFL